MRVPATRPKSLADAILGFGNAFAAVCEWLEDVEDGAEPMRAARKAYRKARRRGNALKKATSSPSAPRVQVRREDARKVQERGEGGVVIDVTPEVERRRKESSR